MDPFDEYQNRKRAARCKRGWRVFGVVFALILVCCAVFIFGNAVCLELELHGESEMTLEYGAAYSEAGAVAVISVPHLWRSETSIPVQISGQPNTHKLGTYTVTYSIAPYQFLPVQQRTVQIVDRIPPEIKLQGDAEIILPRDGVYAEDGFTASDNCDGDLTAYVACSILEDGILYSVEDQSGNRTQVKRTIIDGAQIPPELILTGGNEISITVGQRYEEPGFSALDLWDGDLTEQVTIDGDVDIYQPGVYEVQYFVTDCDGNTASEVRTVTVQAVPQPDVVTPEGKIIYLTFDDGPGYYTQKLLDTLERYNVKATFFVINSERLDLLPQMVEKGHSVGIHSMSHNYRRIYKDEDAFIDDLTGMQSIIAEQTGVTTTLMRFPGGSSNTVSRFNPGIMTRLCRIVGDMGYQFFDWNVDSGDASGAKTAKEVSDHVISAVQKQDISIVLQHDVKSFSVDAVETIIQWGLANGYTFLPLSPDSPCIHHGINN